MVRHEPSLRAVSFCCRFALETRDLGPWTDQGQRTDQEQSAKDQGPRKLAAPLSPAAGTRTASLSLALAGTTGATALPWSVAVTLSVRTTAAALTRTTLPAAESGRPLTRRLAAACMTSGTMATMTLAVAIGIAIGIELSAARAEREVRRLALGNVSFGSRQLCANQRTMDGPIVAFITAGRTLIERVGLGHRLD